MRVMIREHELLGGLYSTCRWVPVNETTYRYLLRTWQRVSAHGTNRDGHECLVGSCKWILFILGMQIARILCTQGCQAVLTQLSGSF